MKTASILFAAAAFLASIAGANGPAAHRSPGWLGIGYHFNVTPGPAGRTVWLFVQQVAPGGPAQRAGLQRQDVITAIDGRALWFRNQIDALDFFGGVNVGQKVVLTVRRGRSVRNVPVMAGKPPVDLAERRRLNEAIAKAEQDQH
jgi:S1-C subfamily serine protease